MIAIGRFSSNKRLERLISLLAALRWRDPRWRLKIAGRAWDLTAGDLAATAEAESVAEAVEIIESPSDATLRKAMADCSVVASASEYEGFGLMAVEGLSAGLFPLLSDIPPFRRLVDRTGLGMVVDFAESRGGGVALRAAVGSDRARLWPAS